MQSDGSVADLMRTDHAELDRLIAEVVDEINADKPDTARSFERLDLFWARLAVHIRSEHLVLFPAAIEAARESETIHENILEIVQELRRDHDFFMKEIASAVKAMRLLFDLGNEQETRTFVRGLIGEVKRLLERHNKLEEDIVYPLAAKVSSGETIRENVLNELQNLPKRFGASGLEGPPKQ